MSTVESELEASHEESRNEWFDPRTEVSADAKFIWKRIFIFFWAIPAGLGFVVWMISLK